jgi:TRAP-type mannitol/chloroaromatic compound transport system substrate-binding protein
MPFGMTTSEQDAWYFYGGGEALAKEVFDKHGVNQYQGGSTGNQMGGWFRKEINSVDDLKGLKMRIPGFAGEVLAELGVAVTNLPAGELYTALERGTIDALEWVGPGIDINMGFHKDAPYYYTGWHEPATDLQFLINQDAWNELPADLQAIIEVAMVDSKARMYWENFAMSAEAWSKMGVDYPNIKVKSFPPEVIAEMTAVNHRLIAETSARDPMFKKIMESQAEFMAKAREWTKMSDYLYLKDNIE